MQSERLEQFLVGKPPLKKIGRGSQMNVYGHPDLPFVVKQHAPLSGILGVFSKQAENAKAHSIAAYEEGLNSLGGLAVRVT